jgi:hypothetical protein
MRLRLVAAVGIVGLVSGCDQLGIGQRAALAPAPPCHCVAAAAPAEPMTRLTPPAEHHRHHARSSHSYSQGWADQYAEEKSSSYTSDSREYDEEEESGASHEDVWVDGYGRQHSADAHVTRVAAEDRDRLDPWHAYKSKCKEHEK